MVSISPLRILTNLIKLPAQRHSGKIVVTRYGYGILCLRKHELFDKIKARYDDQVSPYYAAARLWTDAIIDPTDTRDWISMGIEAANNAPIKKAFNMGVTQV